MNSNTTTTKTPLNTTSLPARAKPPTKTSTKSSLSSTKSNQPPPKPVVKKQVAKKQAALPKLTPQEEIARLQNLYAEKGKLKKANVLLLGESGSGKTYLMNTAPGLTHIDCFDPGAVTGLDDAISEGRLIADLEWSDEDPKKPTSFKAWERRTEARIASGYFDYIDNYMLDSSTTWSAAIMNQVLKNAGIAGQAPRFTHDYGPQKQDINNWIRKLLNLPCNFILTGHLESIHDAGEKKIVRRFMTTGKASILIPLLFDEIWVMEPKATSGGVKYRILTQSTGRDLARSRLSAEGKLDKYEDADFANILKKGGITLKIRDEE